MNVGDARNTLYELTKYYFQNANVVYAKQSYRVKQPKPLVKLSFGPVTRPINPPERIVDGRPARFYPSTMMCQIDLFTAGKQKEIAPGITPVMENTAEDDMIAFANFLNSDYAVQFLHRRDMALVIANDVQDLTDLINDTSYEYRAMIEVELRFTTVAVGYSGTLAESSVVHSELDPETGDYKRGGDIQADDVIAIDPTMEITTSGGGNEEVLADEDGYFENVSINDKLVKEEN